MLFLINKTKDQISWVSSHDLYWENKMYKQKRSIELDSEKNSRFLLNERGDLYFYCIIILYILSYLIWINSKIFIGRKRR